MERNDWNPFEGFIIKSFTKLNIEIDFWLSLREYQLGEKETMWKMIELIILFSSCVWWLIIAINTNKMKKSLFTQSILGILRK